MDLGKNVLRIGVLTTAWLMVNLLSFKAYATHIRAAEITIKKVSTIEETYEFTVTAIRDTGSDIEFGQGVFDFGDGNFIENAFQITKTNLGDELEKNVFTVKHTYAAPKPSYIVSYREENRNEGILNIDNSVNTPFYVESKIRIDPFLGDNNSPVMTVLPIDKGAQFVKFLHNPGAFDPDGDSLSYKLTIPKQDDGVDVFGYVFPNDPKFYFGAFNIGNEAQNAEPIFELDPITGTLTWDAPGKGLEVLNRPLEYNVAIVVEEWRKVEGTWFKLGFVTRDMQIIIERTENERPELIVPDDTCVVANSKLEATIMATDPDGGVVRIEAFGGPFTDDFPSPATFTPKGDKVDDYALVPVTSLFEWQTVCGHVRQRPYEIIFKVTDGGPIDRQSPANNVFGSPKLVDFKTWFVTVVGPPPEGLEVSAQIGRSINLTWDSYECNNADSLEIWRRVDSYEFTPDDCQVGMPGFAGYEMIDLVGVDQVSYLDDNKGQGLAPGAKYCYRLVARFYEAGGVALSYVSGETCDSLEANGPVITNVDVNVTGESDGEIFVRWTPPFDLDNSVFPQPFKYTLVRSEGISGKKNRTILATQTDTFFVDSGINTLQNPYNYKIILLDNNNQTIDSSASASSVRTDLTPLFESIEIKWSANVPWSNIAQQYPYHYVYRDRAGGNDSEMVLIDSVDVTKSGFRYLDNGQFNNTKLSDKLVYCYYVVTKGVYGNERIKEPLINRSQIICGQPNDTIAPCTPIEFAFDSDFQCDSLLIDKPCTFSDFSNRLTWTKDGATTCEDDVREYIIFFSETGKEEDYVEIATISETEYIHENLNSLKGCYKIGAVDRSKNVSILSEPICNDNCPNYRLPNAFSPNNDNFNDTFTPFVEFPINPISGFDRSTCPRFVKNVKFRVFDRTGNELFNSERSSGEKSIFINWDGKTTNGLDLPAGTYYYTADVTFDVLDPKLQNQQIKGWVELIK